MASPLNGVLARLRRLAPGRLPVRLLNASGTAGPRRLATLILVGVGMGGVVVAVTLGGHEVPVTSRDARLKAVDPLPGGLNSTPEQDALALASTDQQAKGALQKGVSFTPPMAPSQPAQPLPPPVQPAEPGAPDSHGPTFVGRPVRPAPRPVAPAPAASFPPPVLASGPASQTLRPIPAAANGGDYQGQQAQQAQQAQQTYNKQIGDLFSQWGGRAPRTDVVLPPTQGDSERDEGTTKLSAPAGARSRNPEPALPVSARSAAAGQILVPAGRGVFAHPVLALSSDQASPVVLQADSGPVAGDRMIGTFAKENSRLVIHISTIIHNGETISCDGVVTAPDTMEAGVASKVDEHYAARFILPAAAAFVSGLGQAIATTSNTTAVLSPLGGATTTTHLNIPQQLGIAAGSSAGQISSVLNAEAPKGATVSLEANVAVGVMFLTSVVSNRVQ